MRTIKTSIAVTISITLAYILKLNSPFFVGVAAIIAMQDNLVDSYRMGRNRVLGTILGAVVGLLGSLISAGNPIIIGIGIIIVIHLCNKLGWNKSISIASIVFISITLNVEEGSELYYSLNRILDTIVGIVVAVIVNFIISPPLTKDKIYSISINIIDEFSQAIKTIVVSEGAIKKSSPLKEIEDKLGAINKEYPILMKEIDIKLYRKDLCDINLQHSKELIKKLYNNINILVEMGSGFNIDLENCKILNKIYDLEIIGSDNLNNLDMVYNYHLKTSLEILEELREIFEMSS
ncbi:aromatic acid exporter family protein [Proteiniborus sp.]|uniref:FUSC family protein n=1 Tax=Proteiniborus sp. TaxID=2079015 RepID=UPI00332A5B89